MEESKNGHTTACSWLETPTGTHRGVQRTAASPALSEKAGKQTRRFLSSGNRNNGRSSPTSSGLFPGFIAGKSHTVRTDVFVFFFQLPPRCEEQTSVPVCGECLGVAARIFNSLLISVSTAASSQSLPGFMVSQPTPGVRSSCYCSHRRHPETKFPESRPKSLILKTTLIHVHLLKCCFDGREKLQGAEEQSSPTSCPFFFFFKSEVGFFVLFFFKLEVWVLPSSM